MVYPGGGDMGDTIYQQCSGVRCQQANPTRCVGVTHDISFLAPMLAISCNPISVQDSEFDFY